MIQVLRIENIYPIRNSLQSQSTRLTNAARSRPLIDCLDKLISRLHAKARSSTYVKIHAGVIVRQLRPRNREIRKPFVRRQRDFSPALELLAESVQAMIWRARVNHGDCE